MHCPQSVPLRFKEPQLEGALSSPPPQNGLGTRLGYRRPGRIYHVIRALSDVTLLYVVLALITEVQWWESVSTPDKHAKQSAPEED